MKIGFIGLGVMGRPMAGHLLAAGHDLFIHRVKEAARPLLDQGAKAMASPKAVADAADTVILMLPDTPDVEAVLFGADSVSEGLSPGKLVIDMSSISPMATRTFAEKVRALGAGYVDAPVSGGEVAAKAGTLTIMAGGTDADFAGALPVLQLMGKNITHIGGCGDGQTAKVVNQVIVGLTIAAVAEGLSLATAAGADPAKVRNALAGGFAGSRILEVHGQRMLEDAFDPGFRIRLHRKDVGLALDAARALNLSLPHTAHLEQIMNRAIAEGLADHDHAALYQVIGN